MCYGKAAIATGAIGSFAVALGSLITQNYMAGNAARAVGYFVAGNYCIYRMFHHAENALSLDKCLEKCQTDELHSETYATDANHKDNPEVIVSGDNLPE